MSLKVIITCMCLENSGTAVRSVTDGDQAFWYYAMLRLHTIVLKSHPIAQFTKNRIIHKKCTKFININLIFNNFLKNCCINMPFVSCFISEKG